MSEFKVTIVPVTAFQQNCAILWDEASRLATVVDPGGDVPRLRETLGRLGVTVETILLTHGHIDHAGGAAELKEALGGGVPIVGPDGRDRSLLNGIEIQAEMYGLRGVRNVLPDRWLSEGEAIEIAGQTFDVLHCPGHTPGHLVYVQKGMRFAIVGDVLFRGSVGRTDFPYGDTEALLTAIDEKLLPLGDDIAFICGHGPGSTFGEERRSNPFLRR